MGYALFDKYSLLHAAVGIIARFWNIGLLLLTVAHIVFEFVENTTTGMRFINNWITIWPGGKDHADTILNQTGDVISSAVGWAFADYCLKYL